MNILTFFSDNVFSVSGATVIIDGIVVAVIIFWVTLDLIYLNQIEFLSFLITLMT